LGYLKNKSYQLIDILDQIRKEKRVTEKLTNGTLQDFYIHNQNKHFIQAFSLATDIVVTLKGAFNAYEIQKLKSKL
jgi:hypothetical protein